MKDWCCATGSFKDSHFYKLDYQVLQKSEDLSDQIPGWWFRTFCISPNVLPNGWLTCTYFLIGWFKHQSDLQFSVELFVNRFLLFIWCSYVLIVLPDCLSKALPLLVGGLSSPVWFVDTGGVIMLFIFYFPQYLQMIGWRGTTNQIINPLWLATLWLPLHQPCPKVSWSNWLGDTWGMGVVVVDPLLHGHQFMLQYLLSGTESTDITPQSRHWQWLGGWGDPWFGHWCWIMVMGMSRRGPFLTMIQHQYSECPLVRSRIMLFIAVASDDSLKYGW